MSRQETQGFFDCGLDIYRTQQASTLKSFNLPHCNAHHI